MKLDTIFELWEQDSKLDKTDLGGEALRISELHHKYYKIYSNERLVLKKYESELKELRLQKQEFYLMGPTEETHAKGWSLPAVGKVLRSDLSSYIDADKDIISSTLKIGLQNEKIDLIESILKTLHGRNFNIRAYIDWEKFKVGQ